MHVNPAPKPTLQPIAVVGVACRFPGAPDLTAFDALLSTGTDAVTEIPAERWTREAFLHPDPRQRGKAYTMAAGVIDGVDRFDAAFFGISPREAVQMDPQQRLLLELTHEAIEHAGLPGRRLAAGRTGVFVGGSSSDYHAIRLGDPSTADAYYMTGATLSTLSNRISYVFDFKGPSFTVDTACSSSLVALHLACTSMRRGEIDMAVVGGVNLMLAPQNFVGFSRAAMLSPRGRCHAFAEGADGYVRAEGGAILLLKPLAAALADDNPILCVVEGTGINSDGRTTGLSLPNRIAQAALLRDVYGSCQVDPEDLVYVEAHGTGTAVGDPIEAGALGEVLGRNRTTPLPIGSVKTNIGHLEAGSGMAGLIKAMLVLRNGTIPASLNCEVPNGNIDFDALNLTLAREAMPIRRNGRPAVGINSFGFGGTNAHAVLTAAPSAAGVDAEEAAALPPLLISARSDAALAELARAWSERLAGMEPGDAAGAVRAAARGREHHLHRLVATADSAGELAAALAAHLAGEKPPEVVSGTAVAAGSLAFVYSGNGSQWAGMGLDAMRNAGFRRAMAEVDAELAPSLGWSVTERLASIDAAGMRRTDVAQPLLFAVQAATMRALGEMGIVASGHFGHSVGEVAAAYGSGALSLADAAHVIVARSVAQASTSSEYGMAVLGTGVDAAQPLLDRHPKVEVAAVNSPGSITVAGPRSALAALEHLAQRRRVPFIALDLDYGFHSAAMDPAREKLLHDLEGIAPGRAHARFYSAVTGTALDGGELGPEYWWRNVRAPVRFADVAAAAIGDGHTILLEIGPNPVLQSYLRDGLRKAEKPGRQLATLSRKQADGDPFRRMAAEVHVAGHDISASDAFDGAWSPEALPSYPWQRQRFWYEPTEEAVDVVSPSLDHPLLGIRRGPAPSVWYNTLDLAAYPFLADHAVDGVALLPATGMVEMVLAAGRARHKDAARLDILDMEITRPVLLERDGSRETRLTVVGERGVFELASRNRLAGEDWAVHATGRVVPGSPAALAVPEAAGGAGPTMPAAELYALTERLGLQYGPAFRTVAGVGVGQGGSATVHLVPAPVDAPQPWILDPARADGALQGLVALAAGRIGAGDATAALLPWRFGRVRLAADAIAPVASARLRIDRVGPRSISADVALLDAAGAPIALLSDCWFRQMPTQARDRLAEATFHTVAVPQPRAGVEQPAVPLPGIAAEADAGEPDEAALLMEAFVTTAALPALWALGPRIDPAALVASGQVHPSSRPLLAALLAWLERDGLAVRDEDAWSLTDPEEADLPPAPEIWRSVLGGAPETVAEAALVGAMAEALPNVLAAGPEGVPGGLGALTAHLRAAAPTARAAAARLAAALAEVASMWPAERPLRVLELGATDPEITARLATVLARSGAAVEYTALLAPGTDGSLIAEAAGCLPGSQAVEPSPGEAFMPLAGGGFDLAVGHLALTGVLTGALTGAAAEALSRVQASLAPGGLLLLAEPRPNRAWDLRFGAEPGWWRADGLSCLMDGAEWTALLASAGFTEGVAEPIGGAIWGASLLRARAHGLRAAEPAATPPEAGLVILADPGDPLAEAVADTLLAGGRRSLVVPLDAAAETLRTMPPQDGDILLVARDDETTAGIAEGGALLAASAKALAETAGVRLWVATRGRLAGAALRGVLRVLANEAPNLRPFSIALDPALAPDDAATLLAAELAAPGQEPEVDLAAGRRDVPRLRRGAGAATAARLPGRLAVRRPGLLGTLGWDAFEPPPPGADQVAIEVAASGLNFRDVMWALGLLPDEALMDGLAGATLGLECTGTVTAVGAGVTHVGVGDRVMAIAPASLATHVLAPAAATVRLPEGVGFAEGATVPVTFLTVCYALGTLANLQPGERVLIHGGAGGVGLAAIQYARHRGAEIFASAGSPAKRALLRLLGVQHVLDSRSLAFADDVMAATGGQGVDVVLNSLAGEAMERGVGVLRPFGRFLELGKRDLYGNTPLGLRALRHNVSYFAIDADQLPVQRPDVARRVFAEIVGLMEQDALRPLPYRAFRFGAATDAFRLMQSAGHVGKIVLMPEPEGPPVTAPAAVELPGLEGTVVVTGGLGGFGLETARFLAARGARSLALLGRRGPATPGAEEALAMLAAEGVDARAVACDAADAASLDAALTTIRAEMPAITGVVHAAMVLDDALLTQLDAERFVRVLTPKLDGLKALDRATRGDPVSLFLVFSSITTTLGNPGQANYVAANAAMEALVAARRAEGLPGLSVGWGPIGDVGVLARDQALSESLAKRMGGAHLRSAEALELLPALLAGGQAHVDVGQVRWAGLRQHLPHLATPIFADLLRGQQADKAEVDIATLLKDSTPDEARAIVGGILAEEVAAITKAPVQAIDLDRSLTDLGMDSLMAVELRMALERRFGGNLPLLSLSDGASVASIAARIVRQLAGGASAETGVVAALAAKYEDIEDEAEAAVVPND